jgi:hypothetical protein
LVRKLSEVMAVVDRIPKNGENKHHGYKYATESDITDAVRAELARRQLIVVPSAVDCKEQPIGDKGQRVFTQKMRFTVMDGESGESLSFEMYGQGSDSLDKGAFKSTTGAVKYALLKLFLIPTGDDPERDEPRREVPPPAGLESIKRHIGSNAARPSPPPQAPATHDRNFVMPFANKENAPLHALSEKSLRWFQSALTQNMNDPAKARFADKAREQLGLIDAELVVRGLA